MVGQAARLILAVAACAAALPAGAQALAVRGGCRDALPHGVYELSMTDGRVRVLGAFNRGKRTSSFLFWTSSGVRVAQIPYDEGTISGTVALWYSIAPPYGDAPWKLQASYANGVLDGPKRSWHPDGKPRGDYAYEGGVLVTAKAWRVSGATMSDAAARAQAAGDALEDARYFATLDAIVDANLPKCEGDAGTRPQ